MQSQRPTLTAQPYNLHTISLSSKNVDPTLFFCRTPLQAMIVKQLLLRFSGPIVVIYHATSSSEKHKYYFDQIEANQKYFVPWRPIRGSDVLSALRVWWEIPRILRKTRYATLLIASIGSVAFSLFASRNKDAIIQTFDDGTFNLDNKSFNEWISFEPISHKFIKKLFDGISNSEIISRVSCHYSIYPSRFVEPSSCTIKEIDLFSSWSDLNLNKNGEKIRIILGSWFHDTHLQLQHDIIVSSGKFNIFLPHPADSRSALFFGKTLLNNNVIDFDKMIAEDVIKALISSGYSPTVYGFGSSVLINLAHYIPAINITFTNSRQGISCDRWSQLGVRSIRYNVKADKYSFKT